MFYRLFGLIRTVLAVFLPSIYSHQKHGHRYRLSSELTTSVIVFLGAFLIRPVRAFGDDYGEKMGNNRYYGADINVTYVDPSGFFHSISSEEAGRYGDGSRISPEQGTLVHVQHRKGGTIYRNGCKIHEGHTPSTRWIALVKRGGCYFKDKIQNAAHKYNASAVLIYNNKSATNLLGMNDEGR